MPSRLACVLLLALGLATPLRAQSSFEFFGCEALGRSCHQATVTVSVPYLRPVTNVEVVRVSVLLKTTFYESGAFYETGFGGGWSINLGQIDFNPFTEDLFHGSDGCYAYLPVQYLIGPNPPALVPGNARFCVGDDQKSNNSWETLSLDYRPLGVSMNIVYEADQTIHPITLTMAPEPSTYALLGAGLLLVGVVHRRRRA